MGLFSFLRRAPEIKASAVGPVISANVVGQPQWTPRDYEHLAKEAYTQNAVAMRCVKLIATAAAEVDWLLRDRDGETVPDHPVLDLLNRPSPMMGGAAFFEAVYAFLLLSGNSYVEAVGPEAQPPRELWYQRPDRIQIIPGAQGMPQAYRYEYQGQWRDWRVDPVRGRSNLLHLKEFHPTEDWFGMSRVEAAAYGVDRHNAAGAHNKALLDNGARPSGALVYEPIKPTPDSPEILAPEGVINSAFDKLMERQGGPENAGKPMVLNGAVRWLDMATSPKDMDFEASKNDAARDICTAFGVPHILIVPGSATYNNMAEAKLQLYEDTICPLLDRVIDDLNAWLMPRYGSERLALSYDKDSISALEPRREARRKSMLDLVGAGVLSADEAREALQYGPRGADAVEKLDPGVITALLSASEQVGDEPLFRYLRDRGALHRGATVEDMRAASAGMFEDDETFEDEQEAGDGDEG